MFTIHFNIQCEV